MARVNVRELCNNRGVRHDLLCPYVKDALYEQLRLWMLVQETVHTDDLPQFCRLAFCRIYTLIGVRLDPDNLRTEIFSANRTQIATDHHFATR